MSRTTCRAHGHSTRRTSRAALLLGSASALVLPLLTSPAAGSAATGAPDSARAPVAAAAAACRAPVVAPIPTGPAAAQQRLDGVRVGRHDDAGFDRVVFELSGVPGYQVRRVKEVVADGSGRTLNLRGRAFLIVRLEPAVAHDEDGRPTSPRRLRRDFKTVRVVRRVGDFEGVVTYGIGLRRMRDYRAFTTGSPARLVIDVAHRGRRPFDCRPGAVQVVFATSDATPATTTRRVPTPALMRGALTALYAGPTDYDRPAGLVFVSSESTGFTRLRLRNGVARVQLTGGCDSGGATFTVANEIIPTLKQFGSVKAVKIYDPAGTTERPRGRTDSIPTCLEP